MHAIVKTNSESIFILYESSICAPFFALHTSGQHSTPRQTFVNKG